MYAGVLLLTGWPDLLVPWLFALASKAGGGQESRQDPLCLKPSSMTPVNRYRMKAVEEETRDCLHWIFDKFASEPLHSLDTLSVLGLQAEFNEAVNAAATLGLETSEECIVNLSEWNIQVPWTSFGGL